MANATAVEPLRQFAAKGAGSEILAPQQRIRDAGLGERSPQIQCTDESGPLPRPVRKNEDRSAMMLQAHQHMMRILPDSLGHDQRGIGMNAREHLATLRLR